jgi:hypothetical protein
MRWKRDGGDGFAEALAWIGIFAGVISIALALLSIFTRGA